MPSVPVFDGFVAVAAADRLLLGPDAARLLGRALDREIAVQRRDGIVSGRVAELREALALVGSIGRVGRPQIDKPEESVLLGDPVAVSEAAGILGLGERHTRRLAREGRLGPCRTDRGRLVLSREDVAAVAAERQAE